MCKKRKRSIKDAASVRGRIFRAVIARSSKKAYKD